jgi:hypothetical protein
VVLWKALFFRKLFLAGYNGSHFIDFYRESAVFAVFAFSMLIFLRFLRCGKVAKKELGISKAYEFNNLQV